MNKNIQPGVILKKSIWDYLFYASLLIIFIWLILKVTGVINTPAWLEYGVPIGGAIITFLTFYQGLMDRIIILSINGARSDERLMHMERDVGILKKDVETLKAKY